MVPLDVCHAAHSAQLQHLPNLCPVLLFFRAVLFPFSHYINLQCDASILHLFGGLHNFQDGLRFQRQISMIFQKNALHLLIILFLLQLLRQIVRIFYQFFKLSDPLLLNNKIEILWILRIEYTFNQSASIRTGISTLASVHSLFSDFGSTPLAVSVGQTTPFFGGPLSACRLIVFRHSVVRIAKRSSTNLLV